MSVPGGLAPLGTSGKVQGDCFIGSGALIIGVMRRAVIVLVLFLAPLAVLAAVIAVDRVYGTPGRGYDYVVKVDLARKDDAENLPRIEGPIDATRPMVVIDPGHGGKDPGAGNGAFKEKWLTLTLALALRDQLLRQGGVRVALTRTADNYLFLEERSAISRKLGADLFISIHADSTEEAGGAVGATVYTLSARGSNQVAERIAARENAADQINGVRIDHQDDAVSAILVELSQRQTQTNSEQFAALILREGRGLMPFRETSPQSAAFAVLKAPDVPSVLFESGYINNSTDSVRLTSVSGRQMIVQSLARAIRAYFARSAASRVAG